MSDVMALLFAGLLAAAPDAGHPPPATIALFRSNSRALGWINHGDCVLRYADDATDDERAWVRVQWAANCKQMPEEKCCPK